MRKHRKLRGKKLKKQRKIIIVSIISLTILLSTGYAAFSTNISLSAKGNIKEKPAADKIIENEGVQEASSTVDGLYKDTTEDSIDGKYRYIYKGKDPNNYIEFNDEVWRIYSIEPDGSIKITKSDLLTSRVFDAKSARPKSTNTYCTLDSDYGCNAWAANSNLTSKPSSFVNGSVTGAVSEDSEMLTYLNNDYYVNTLKSNTNVIAHDWNVGPAGTDNDTYTLAQLASSTYEGKYKWNGKVALLTKSEYMRASSNSSCATASYWYNNYSKTTCKGSDYLYNSSTHWWLLSPRSGNSASVLCAYSGGFVNYDGAYGSNGVRPALYLSSKIKITGSGTNDSNIYKIVE